MSIDPRGPRFSAALTTAVLAAALITESPWLLAVQAVVFAIGALAGVQHTPYAWLFRRFVRPRLGPPADLEDPRPPRFAQAVGLVFALVGVAAGAASLTPLFLAATGLALAAAFLNAAFGFCLGCEMYLIIRRILPTREEIPA
jgi:FtsH-binding integral membrane protein